MKEVFENIIENNLWAKHTCGPGSTFEATESLRSALPTVFDELNVKSFLDAPCGDFSWMSTIDFGPTVEYIGGDIVSSLILKNQENFPKKKFKVIDITLDTLPNVDLLFCRDCLQHLNFKSIDMFFANFLKSGIKYLALTNYTENYFNEKDIEIGDARYLNFTESPFNFEKPLYSLKDYIVGKGRYKKYILIWSRDQIQRSFDDYKKS